MGRLKASRRDTLQVRESLRWGRRKLGAWGCKGGQEALQFGQHKLGSDTGISPMHPWWCCGDQIYTRCPSWPAPGQAHRPRTIEC